MNVKRAFRGRCAGMMDQLKICGLEHAGRHHSGIDDVRNIANIALFLLNRGYMFEPTNWGCSPDQTADLAVAVEGTHDSPDQVADLAAPVEGTHDSLQHDELYIAILKRSVCKFV